MNRKNGLRGLSPWLCVMAALMLWGCASMGRPEGGPRDVAPPVYVRSNPVPGQLEFKGSKVVIEFDENVQLDDAMNKVIVSPPQQTTPKISALGRRVTVELRDTLLENTTYTIDFSDAIKDLNEGNVLDGMALDFSTGTDIDTLRISGMVFQASNLEPAQGMVVGAWREDSLATDTSAVAKDASKQRIERITKTNQLGQFTLRNLQPGVWHVIALNDVNRDYKWDRSEDVAFLTLPVVPGSRPEVVMDTLTSTDGRDSLVRRGVTRFLPDDVLLTWFNEDYKPQYLVDYSRPERNKLAFRFNAANDSLPTFKVLGTDEDLRQAAVLQSSATLDTLTYWLRDSLLIGRDTILIQARYLKTDSTDALAQQVDTLKFVMKKAKGKGKKKEEKEDGKSDTTASIPRIPPLGLSVSVQGQQDLNKPLIFTASTPVARFDSTAVHLEMTEDSVWIRQRTPRILLTDSLNPLVYTSELYPWREGVKYKLTVDSAGFADIYGAVNKEFAAEFTTRTMADYSSLRLTVTPTLDHPAVVELLNAQDAPVRTASVVGGLAVFEHVNPGSYYARLYIDADSNGVWTNGSLTDSIQPEEVFYYPKKITLKKNWTVEQTWDIYGLPLDQQKPKEIKKNKPKLKAGEMPEKQPGDTEEEDEFFDDPFMKAATGNRRDDVNGLNSNRRRY